MQSISEVLVKLVMWLITGDDAQETTWKCFVQHIIVTIVRLAVLVVVYLLLTGKFDDMIIGNILIPALWLLTGGARR